jgi:hypothetical protein
VQSASPGIAYRSNGENHLMKKWLVAIGWAGLAILGAGIALAVYVFGSFLLVMFGVIAPWNIGSFCIADDSVKSENVGGFDFEFEDTNCDVIAKQQIMLVYVSRHGQRQRHVLAAYVAVDQIPTATREASGTVRLSLGKVELVYVKENRWRDLRVTYDYVTQERATP